MSKIKFLVPAGMRLLLLLLTAIVGMVITGFAAYMLSNALGPGKAVAAMRISTVLQDIFMLILPAVITALIVTRQPARLLCLDSSPTLWQTVLAMCVLCVSSPLMSWIIELNASLHLPASMSALEASLRAMEDSAAVAVDLMMGADTLPNIVLSILIVGVLAGLSEELFFRGALQRLLASTTMSRHAAVWTAAVVFSAIHLQFFGFVPRLLLGAFFGYLLMWSGSVWLPVLIHTANNSAFIILKASTGSGELNSDTVVSTPAVIISAVLTVIGLRMLYNIRKTAVTQPSIKHDNQ